jgi:hypothetical protein
MPPDFDHPVSSSETIPAPFIPDWRLAIDFGTTHTSIAVAVGTVTNEVTDDILQSIGGFPGDRALDQIDMQVPTEIAYLSEKNENAVSLHTGRNVLYGYQVKRAMELPEGDVDRTGFHSDHRVCKMKLLLDPSAYTTGLREKLQMTLSALKEKKIIRKDEEVITDLLACYLRHTKHVLQMDYGLSQRDTGTCSGFELSQHDPLNCFQLR